MSEPLNVVFMGNHTVGVRALRVIAGTARLVGVVAHPDDPEDGVRYESVFAEAARRKIPVIRATGRGPEVERFLRDCAPDLIWVTDYRYLLPASVLRLPRRGVVNLHPSLLPKYRGRASINWAILRGERELGLSAHFVDEGMDTGDILAQRRYQLGQHEDVGDALNKLYPHYESITAEVLAQFAAGVVTGRSQDHTQATQYPRRKPEDGLVDWSRPALEVWNLVRAVAAPYPGAFTEIAGARLRLWKAAAIRPFAPGGAPLAGEIVSGVLGEPGLQVACADAVLELADYAVEGACAVQHPALALAQN